MADGEEEARAAQGEPAGAAPRKKPAKGKATVQGVGAPPARSLDLGDSSPGELEAPKKSLATIELSGLLATSPDAVRRRLIGPWAEGLRQYLSLRLGDVDLAAQKFSELKREVEATKMEEIVVAPGARARIYRMARALGVKGRGGDATAQHLGSNELGKSSPLAFRAPLKPALGYAEALVRLREGLPPADAELLELRWARELTVEEIAFVLDVDDKSVMSSLGRGVSRARELLGEHGKRGAGDPIGAAVVDAFALARAPEASDAPSPKTEVGLEPGTLIGGRYRVEKQVGAGAFGEVYRAEDQDVPGHVVAIKLLREPALSEKVREHHLRELKLIAAVFHPSIVHFKDHGWYDDRLWFVMPWYEGETLERRMRRMMGIDRREARRIFEPVARAMATLHGSGIRHQDIKPDNVFLARIHGAGDDDGVLPVLLDLGVAATEHEALIGGTPVYFAPEVAAHYAMKPGAPDVGPPADVFAMALSLRNALEPESEEDVPAGAVEAFIEKRSRTAPPALTRPDLVYLKPHFERWLSLDSTERPTAEAFARELAVLTQPEEEREKRRRLLSWLLPIILVAVTVVAALGYVYVRERELSARALSAARDDAARAHEDTARVSADLMIEEARREAVESDHEELRREYDEERLTRDQLSTRLATAEGEIRILRDRLGSVIAARNTAEESLASTRTDLGSVRAELERTSATLASVRGELAAETTRRGAAESTLEETRRRSQADLEASRARVSELESELTTARLAATEATRREGETSARLDEATTARRSAEDARNVAEAARDRAQSELEAAERTIASLRRQLEEASAPRAGGGDPPAEPSEPAP